MKAVHIPYEVRQNWITFPAPIKFWGSVHSFNRDKLSCCFHFLFVQCVVILWCAGSRLCHAGPLLCLHVSRFIFLAFRFLTLSSCFFTLDPPFSTFGPVFTSVDLAFYRSVFITLNWVLFLSLWVIYKHFGVHFNHLGSWSCYFFPPLWALVSSL